MSVTAQVRACFFAAPAVGPKCQGFGTCSITWIRGNPIAFVFIKHRGQPCDRSEPGGGEGGGRGEVIR